ncbi:MAG: hypothetical protein ABI579_09770, partial [Candidatus Sumerlaeota bacterium]
MSTRPQNRRLLFSTLLGLIALSAVALAGEYGPNPFPIDRIDAGRMSPGDPLVASVMDAVGEDALLAIAETVWADHATSAAASQEQTLLNVAIRLREEGTEESLPLLDRLAADKPRIMTYEMICREVTPLPLYPYAMAAQQSAFNIRFKAAGEAFADRSRNGDFAWITEAADLDEDGPVFAASRAQLKGAPMAKLSAVRSNFARNIATAKQSRSEQRLFSESC